MKDEISFDEYDEQLNPTSEECDFDRIVEAYRFTAANYTWCLLGIVFCVLMIWVYVVL